MIQRNIIVESAQILPISLTLGEIRVLVNRIIPKYADDSDLSDIIYSMGFNFSKQLESKEDNPDHEKFPVVFNTFEAHCLFYFLSPIDEHIIEKDLIISKIEPLL